MILIIYSIIFLYLLLILSFWIGFIRLNSDVSTHDDSITFSVVIPFRNEANPLPDLLASIKALKYDNSKFEIILVDDASTDASTSIINTFITNHPELDIRLLQNVRNSNSPKKDAITTAIQHTQYNWIVTTDADCLLPEKWLASFNNYIITHQPNMIVAPVTLVGDNSFLHQFQSIDFLSMQGATIGGFGIGKPFMANGANLAYKKDVFLAFNGFQNNNTIASGDDVFLLEDFIKMEVQKVHFLKNTDALVQTYVLNSWNGLINQRKRWAAKAPQFNNRFTKIVGALVFLANFCTAISIILFPFYGLLGYGLLAKFTIDSLLIFKTAKGYQQPVCITQYLKILVFYPFFTIFIAIFSLCSNFSWKGRQFDA